MMDRLRPKNYAFMRYRKPTHPVTADHRREIDIRALTKAGAFKRPMKFPFQRIEVTARDHVRLYPLAVRRSRQRPDPQVIRVTWRKMTFGLKPFFVCPRCQKRRVFLYFDGLQAYCRACGDLWFRSQQVRRRTRLLHRSHRIRVSLGDQFGKPGDKFPVRPYLQTRRRYHRIIAKLKYIEDSYRHVVANDGRRYRDRDEYGRYLPNEVSADRNATEELGR
jgi:hypothetical protein